MCPYCKSSCIRYGKSSTGKERFRYQTCKRTHSKEYFYPACKHHINNQITQFIKEGCGIRSISRLLKIGVSTVLRRILTISKEISKPPILFGKEYEIDELCTYIRNKKRKRWIVYAIRKDTGEVTDFTVGSRTNNTLKRVTDTIILSNASKICTDKLPNYRSLLPSSIHNTKRYQTNRIERKNLNLRTHLKRLNRRTICYSKSITMLTACLKIYFWT